MYDCKVYDCNLLTTTHPLNSRLQCIISNHLWIIWARFFMHHFWHFKVASQRFQILSIPTHSSLQQICALSIWKFIHKIVEHWECILHTHYKNVWYSTSQNWKQKLEMYVDFFTMILSVSIFLRFLYIVRKK